MTEQDKIKREALEVLDKYVKESIKYWQDNKQQCSEITVDVAELELSPEHIAEIRSCIEKLATREGFYEYCKYRGIEYKQ